MSRATKHLKLVRTMMSEERRLNASMIGNIQFLLFPVVILIMSFVLGLAAKQLLKNMPLDQAYLLLQTVILLYGVSVGGLAAFGDRIAERRFGSISLILQTPATQPITYRELFTAFYLKEIIYYFLYSIVPIVGGIALTIPLTGFQVSSVLFLLLTLTLSFLLGLSFSFFFSAIGALSKMAQVVILGLLGMVVLVGLLTNYDIGNLVPSIALQRTHDPAFLLLALGLFAIFSAVALMTIRVKAGQRTERYDARMLETAESFSFVGANATLMGKDWIDLLRSRTLVSVLTAYVGPLAVLAALFWFLGTMLTVRFELNLVFYASMIGFFSVSIYSWLNLLDNNAFMEVLPISVGQVIRTKLLLLSMIALLTSTVFLVVLGLLLGQLGTFLMGLIVAYVTTAYTVTVTAYLTGLRTNSYLFDPKVLAKFSGLSVPPLCALVILSFMYSGHATLAGAFVLVVCTVLVLIMLALYRRIGKRWDRATFVF